MSDWLDEIKKRPADANPAVWIPRLIQRVEAAETVLTLVTPGAKWEELQAARAVWEKTKE